MKLFSKKKKGFTIVELVIVVAVIAVLSAILIPTFVGLVNKAHIAADDSLVRDLNNVLAIDREVNGEHKTMSDALKVTDDYGFNVSRINAKAQKSEILWDSVNDVFCYFDGEEIKYIPETKLQTPADEVEPWQYFVIKRGVATSDDLSDKYSTYLYQSTATSLTTTKGLDVGEATTVSSITYSNNGTAQDVVIRTNGGTLTVNASADTVRHYGEAQVVTLTAVADHSYYEHGSVNLVDIQKGRLVITNDATAEVGSIYLTATVNNYDGIVLATMNGATLPEVVAREAVELPEVGQKKLVAVVEQVNENGVADPAKTENIYLYAAQTAYEETKGYTGVSELGTLVLEAPTGTGSFTIKVKDGNTEKEVTVNYADLDESVTEEKTTTLEEVVAAATMFAGGKGTDEAPYIISKANEWNNMYVVMKKAHEEKGDNYPTIYFKLSNDVDLGGYGIDCLDGWDYYNHMSFDGQGYTVKNVDTILCGGSDDDTFVLWPRLENSTIKNVTINYAISDDGGWGFGMCYVPRNNTHFVNVKTTGYIESTTAAWISTFGMYAGFNSTTYYEYCTNEANLIGFYGQDCYITPFGSHCGGTGAKVSFEKCSNYGSISGGDAAGFVGMGNADHFIFVGDDAAVNYGEINGSKKAGHFQFGTNTTTFTATGTGINVTNTVCGNGSKLNTITSFTTNAPSQFGDYLSFDSLDSATTYKVRITVATQRYNYDDGSNKDVWAGGFPVTLFNQVVDSETINTAFMKAYVYESNNTKKDCRTNENCSYSGLYAPDGFSLDNAEVLLEENGFYLVKYNDKYFYYVNLGEYDGLLTTTMQNDNSKKLSVSFDIVAYNQKGSVIGTSSCSYSFSIDEAKNAR